MSPAPHCRQLHYNRLCQVGNIMTLKEHYTGLGAWLRRRAHVPHGPELRVWLGWLGLGLGWLRIVDLGRAAQLSFAVTELFGGLLLLGGLALLVTVESRLTWWGRLAAIWATFCFAFVTVGVLGSTAAYLYALCTASCIAEAASRRSDVC